MIKKLVKNVKPVFKKWWIYLGPNGDGTVDTKYFMTQPETVSETWVFVGTCEVLPEFFGSDIKDRFKEQFQKYAEQYYQEKIKTIFNM